jgi:hypothetical protein
LLVLVGAIQVASVRGSRRLPSGIEA